MSLSRKAAAAIVIVVIVIIGVIGAYALLGTSSGIVSVYIKDQLASWKHINVTFLEVQIHEASEGNESGWHTLSVENGTLDLVSLTDVSALLASSDVDTGNYTQIRIVIISVIGVMQNGTNVTFFVPSGELKTAHPFNVTAGETTNLTIDIDLEHSITYSAQRWIFKPILGSVSEGRSPLLENPVEVWEDGPIGLES